MIAESTVVVDGQTYQKGEEIPDLGSIECVSADGAKREYWGLSIDESKLPKYDNLATGSSCLMLDTGEYWGYISYNKTWYKL